MKNEINNSFEVGVFCRCGRIVFVTEDNQGKIDNYFDMGYKIGKVSKKDIKENFGCQCKKNEQTGN